MNYNGLDFIRHPGVVVRKAEPFSTDTLDLNTQPAKEHQKDVYGKKDTECTYTKTAETAG